VKSLGNRIAYLLALLTVTVAAAWVAASRGAIQVRAQANAWRSSGPVTTEVFSCLAIDPVNPRIVYAGLSYRGIGESGVYKSTDGGATWAVTGFPKIGASALAIDPSQPNTLYVSAGSFIGGAIYKSTNGGATWVTTGYNFGDTVSMAVHPNQPNTIYAGTNFGVYKSTDGGTTWTRPSGFDPIVPALALDPNNPQIVYIATHNNGVYKSTDGGATWKHTSLDDYSSHPRLAVDPNNPNILYATYGDVHKTTDGGATWNKITGTLPARSALGVAADASGTVYVGTDSGAFLYRSTNGGTSWSEFNTGLPQRTVSELAVDRTGTSLHAALEYAGVYDYQFASQQQAPTIAITATAQGQTVGNDGILELNVPAGGTVEVSFSAVVNPGSGSITKLEWRSNDELISTQASFKYSFGRGAFGAYLIGLTVENSAGLKKTQGIGITLKETAALPDLTASAVVGSGYSPGQRVEVPVTITRAGGQLTRGTYVTARLYWSANNTLDGSDQQLWESNGAIPDYPNSVLNTTGSKTVTPAITIPSGVTGGAYYLLAVADADAFHPESNEANNVTAYQVMLRNSCSLSCSALAPSEAVINSAASFALTYSLSNCPGAPALEWNFGDGQRGGGAMQRHAYSTPGTYNWTATASLANAARCTRSGQILVRNKCAIPIITAQPMSVIIARNRSVTLNVSASGTPPLRYQWYSGARGDTSSPINGATASNYTTPALSASTSYWVRVSNTCGARDVPYADSGPALVTVTEPQTLTIETIDPACATQAGCTGEFLKEITSGTVLPDPNRNRLAQASIKRVGAVADGITLLLLRVRSQVAVKFSLAGAPDRGVLLKLNGTTGDGNGSEVTDTPQADGMAFALYRAPLDLTAATVIINAVSARGNGQQWLTLYRPPVVLVHGVWSSGFAWLGLEQRLRREGFDTFGRVDYAAIPGQVAGSFDPFSTDPNHQKVIGALHQATNFALVQMRKTHNVAATQVDVVGHSMGGLVARARTKSSFPLPYERLGNYKKGDFHKLITVGTPHQGTPLADWLIEHKCDIITLGGRNGTIENRFNEGLLDAGVRLFTMPIGPAIYGFQTMSAALKNIGATNVPGHAIVGIAPNDSKAEIALNLVSTHSGKPPDYSSNRGDTMDFLLGGDGKHDTIVPVTSQRGGLTEPAVTEQPWGIVHADIVPFTSDIGETDSQEVWTRIIELLQSPTGSSLFGKFTALNPPSLSPGEYTCPPTFVAGTVEAASNLDSVATLSPAPGTVVRPGEIIEVHFSPSGGNSVGGAVFTVGGKFLVIDGSGPFSFTYVVPDQQAGKLTILADSFGGGTQNYFASTYLIIKSEMEITSLTASPDSMLFEQIGEQLQLRITGQFADETIIDLTSSTAGTSYTTESGTSNIISVSAEGLLQAKGLGRETILISNAGKTMRADIYVSTSGEPTEIALTSVSAASYFGTSLAPESIVAGFGVNLAKGLSVAAATPLPTLLGGTGITVRDSVGTERPASLFFVSPGQVNFQIPPGTATGVATFILKKEFGFSVLASSLIEGVAPGLFTANASGQGVPAAVLLRVKPNSAQNYEPISRYDSAQNQFVPLPIDLGPEGDQVFLILYGTGWRFRSDLSAVAVKIGGAEAETLYAGAAEGFVGLDQLNVRVPRNLAGHGEAEIALTVDGRSSNTVRVNIR